MNGSKLVLFLFVIFNMRPNFLEAYASENYIPGHIYNEQRNSLGFLALNTYHQNPKYGWKQVDAFLRERYGRQSSVGRFKFEYQGKRLTDLEILTLQQLRLILQQMIARIGLKETISFFINFQEKLSLINSGIVADLPADDLLPDYKEMLEVLNQAFVQDIKQQEMLCEILNLELFEKLGKESLI